jgi:hypothetical protein
MQTAHQIAFEAAVEELTDHMGRVVCNQVDMAATLLAHAMHLAWAYGDKAEFAAVMRKSADTLETTQPMPRRN